MGDIRFTMPTDLVQSNPRDARDNRRERDVIVDSDGDVSIRDYVSGGYTVHHSHCLTDADVVRARALADQVRAGTHHVVAGRVAPVRHSEDK